MTTRCSAAQVAEAVLIWSAQNGPTPVLCIELEDAKELKCLDLIFSTLDVFTDAFTNVINYPFIKCNEHLFTKKIFVEYLKPRALLLTEKNGYFDFFLACTYFSQLAKDMALDHDCFHFARVASKLLTKVLEQRFQEIFEAPSGWENLIAYCINIHAAVYPSKINRPPGYDPFNTSSHSDQVSEEFGSEKEELGGEVSNVTDVTEGCKNIKFNGEFEKVSDSKNSDRIKGDVESSRVNLSDPTPQNKLNELNNIEVDSCCVSVTADSTYWSYYDLNHETICERLKHCEGHLEDVNNLLKRLEQNVDTDCILSDEYDVSISDDEYIEQLEKEAESTFEPECKISISDEVKKCLTNANCSIKNKFLGDYTLPEDISDEEIFKYIILNMEPEDDNAKCELCEGKIRAFTKNWIESFHEKYPNSDIVTNVI